MPDVCLLVSARTINMLGELTWGSTAHNGRVRNLLPQLLRLGDRRSSSAGASGTAGTNAAISQPKQLAAAGEVIVCARVVQSCAAFGLVMAKTRRNSRFCLRRRALGRDFRPRIITQLDQSMDVHAAAVSGDVEGVRQYIADSGDPNILNEAGITPLHR